MISRLELDSDRVDRALFPITGHAISVHPDRKSAVFVAMNDRPVLLVEPRTLDVLHSAEPHADGFVFGGHAVYTADADTVLVAERFETYAPYSGRLRDHFGRISVRDARTLAVLDVYDSHGIAPHDMVLFDDGKHFAVANYGSTGWPTDREALAENLPFGVEPALTVLEVGSGRLVHKTLGPARNNEIRHVAGNGFDRIGVIQTRLTSFADARGILIGRDFVYNPDASDKYGRAYLPVPFLHFDLSAADAKTAMVMTDDPLLMQRGQSIVYDPAHDEMP